jgi:hypothetical protein
LVRVKEGDLKAEEMDEGQYFLSVKIRNKGISLFEKSSMSMVLSSMKKRGVFERAVSEDSEKPNIPLMIGRGL